ncbi:MAG: hypothetical protein H5U06_04180 [Candidatus Aminicenantes bacterium]|nr:hypothetical protein [Candidatus Aminicenantes bacterium]
MKRLFASILPFILLAGHIYCIELKRVETWNFKQIYKGQIISSFFDSSGDLIITFGIQPVLLNKNNSIPFATFGQGPNEITHLYTLCKYNEDLALFEDVNKIKVFTKKGGTYLWKETLWLRRDSLPFFLKSALFYKGYFFLAGMKILRFPAPDNMDTANLQIFEQHSNSPGKSIMLEVGIKPDRQYEIERFLLPYKDHVLYLKQNEMKIHFISIDKLEVDKTIQLFTPTFYRSMPKNFYIWKDYKGNHREYLIDLETWAMSYSAITNVIIYKNDHLMVQIRTCSQENGKFAILLYDLKNNYQLEGLIFLNDLLLAERDGYIYCYKGGNPGLDDTAERNEIIIYRIID